MNQLKIIALRHVHHAGPDRLCVATQIKVCAECGARIPVDGQYWRPFDPDEAPPLSLCCLCYVLLRDGRPWQACERTRLVDGGYETVEWNALHPNMAPACYDCHEPARVGESSSREGTRYFCDEHRTLTRSGELTRSGQIRLA